MKKTFVATLVLTMFITGCDDKKTAEQLAQKEQMIAQLRSETAQLKTDLALADEKNKQIIPAVLVEPDRVFNQKEKVIYPKNDLELESGELHIEFSTVNTNIDWLNRLLFTIAGSDNDENGFKIASKAMTRDELKQKYQQIYKDKSAEMKAEPVIGTEEIFHLNFRFQYGKFAVFSAYRYGYSGGAHGMYNIDYFPVDLTAQKIITLDDLFDKENQPKLGELIAESYHSNASDASTVQQDPLPVTTNIYFDYDGIHFVYQPYEIASFAEGTPDIMLRWSDVKTLLKSEFKTQNAYFFSE